MDMVNVEPAISLFGTESATTCQQIARLRSEITLLPSASRDTKKPSAKHCIYTRYSYFYYRATLCVSAVFAVAGCPSICLSVSQSVSLSVCLSVCLSVTLVHCIHMAEDIVKLLSRPGSPIILVF